MLFHQKTDRAPVVDWNEINVATLKRMWAAGDSCSVIAMHIPGATRSAVIGKIYRLKLASRATKVYLPHTRHGGSTGMVAQRKPRAPAEPRPVRQGDPRMDGVTVQRIREMKRKPEGAPLPGLEISDDATDLLIPIEQRRTLLTLDAGLCKFCVGDPLTPDHFFCGALAEKRVDRWGNEHHLPYCGPHLARCWDPARTRRSQTDSEERAETRERDLRTAAYR